MQQSGCCSLIASSEAIKAPRLELEPDRSLCSQTHGNSHTQCDGAECPPELMARVGRSTGDREVTFSMQEQSWGESFGSGDVLREERDLLNGW